jgi:hypothetical protein
MDGKSRAQIYSTWSPSLWRYISDDHDLANNDDDGFDNSLDVSATPSPSARTLKPTTSIPTTAEPTASKPATLQPANLQQPITLILRNEFIIPSSPASFAITGPCTPPFDEVTLTGGRHRILCTGNVKRENMGGVSQWGTLVDEGTSRRDLLATN